MATSEKVTEEQALGALQQLSGVEPEESEPEAPVQEPAEVEEAPAETPTEPEVAASPGVESDDVASLKKRIEEREKQTADVEKKYQERLTAQQQRYSENERILRERHLRKSTVTDKALRVLKASRSETGVPEAEVDGLIREIEGTMNPASPSYVPPQPSAAATEEQKLILNGFLNERGMTIEESNEFGKWMRNEAATVMSVLEQQVAGQSLDGFLRIAHSRWQEGMREAEKKAKQTDAVDAVKVIQRTQKEAARAASASPGAPRKQPLSPDKQPDYKKMTKDDVSALLRQSVEQYR